MLPQRPAGSGAWQAGALPRVRLGAAERLLRDTELKLEAVALESGFGSARRLCTVFADAHGMSPNAWRQQAKGGGVAKLG